MWVRISGKKGSICGCDVCRNCAIITNISYLQEECFIGDYPDYYCKKCWQAGKEICEEIHQIRDRVEEEENKLWIEWRKLSA